MATNLIQQFKVAQRESRYEDCKNIFVEFVKTHTEHLQTSEHIFTEPWLGKHLEWWVLWGTKIIVHKWLGAHEPLNKSIDLTNIQFAIHAGILTVTPKSDFLPGPKFPKIDEEFEHSFYEIVFWDQKQNPPEKVVLIDQPWVWTQIKKFRNDWRGQTQPIENLNNYFDYHTEIDALDPMNPRVIFKYKSK